MYLPFYKFSIPFQIQCHAAHKSFGSLLRSIEVCDGFLIHKYVILIYRYLTSSKFSVYSRTKHKTTPF